MSTWAPGDGGPDLLAAGPEGPLWTDRFRTAAVAVVCLAAGAFVGTRWQQIDLPLTGGPTAPDAAVMAGVVTAVVDPGDTRPHRFQVSLFNPGEEEVEVAVLGLVGTTTPVTGPPVTVAPHRWARARFSLPAVCEDLTLPRVTALDVLVKGPASEAQERVDLAESADVVQEDRNRECVPPSLLGRRDLTGLWYVDEVRGRWQELAGRTLMRFTSDGRFALDPEGKMFAEGKQGFFGTYRLHGNRLRLRADGGYACTVGFTDVWRTTQLNADVLRLDIVHSDPGYCNSPPGERQVLRRLLPERGLPPAKVLDPH